MQTHFLVCALDLISSSFFPTVKWGCYKDSSFVMLSFVEVFYKDKALHYYYRDGLLINTSPSLLALRSQSPPVPPCPMLCWAAPTPKPTKPKQTWSPRPKFLLFCSKWAPCFSWNISNCKGWFLGGKGPWPPWVGRRGGGGKRKETESPLLPDSTSWNCTLFMYRPRVCLIITTIRIMHIRGYKRWHKKKSK